MITDYIKKYFGQEVEEGITRGDVYKSVGTGALSVIKNIVGGLKSTGQSSLRGMAGIGSALTGKTLTPSTYFQKELYGTDKPLTAGAFGAELGLSEEGKYAAPVGFALAATDLIPGGQVSKRGAVALLKNANKADDALKILTKTMGVAKNVAVKYLDDAIRLTDEKQLLSLVDKVVTESQSVSRFIQKGKNLITGAKPLQADPLLTEARGKSLEEFVKAQGTPIYHGSNEKINVFSNKKGAQGVIWFTDNPKAITAGESGAQGTKFINERITTGKKFAGWDEYEKFGLGQIQDMGFDGIKLPTKMQDGTPYNDYILFDNKTIKTKSQLTDIWKRANKAVKPATTERGFISSAKEILPDANKIFGQYIPRGTDELSIKAKNLIKTNFAQAERMALTGSDDNAVAIASELLKKYADDASKATSASVKAALNDKAAQIANTLAPKLTEHGRAIQAASILGRLTPEGLVRFAAREIQRFNETAKVKIPELTGEQAGFISSEMKAINNMSDGKERAMRFQKLQEYVQDLVPTPVMKKIIAVWKAGLLTGLKTQGLNIFSNLSHQVTEVAKDLPASMVDSVASLFTGERTKTFTTRGYGKGLAEGFEKGVQYFKTGFDERNIGAKLDYKRVNFGKGIVAKAFKTYTDTVFRFLGAQDQPFYYGALSRSLMDQALAQGKNLGLKGQELINHAYKIVENPTETMLRYGVADATTAVFQNKTVLGEAASKFQRIPGVGEIILPFGRTPSAVAMQIINYSPVGLAKTIIENIGKGKFDQRLFSQGIGRSLTGTAVLAIGLGLFKKGMMTLDYPVGKEREQELQKAEGTKDNAVLIDGKWRSPIVLGPAGNLLLIGGHLQNALDKSGSATEALSEALFGGLKSFTEQTFLTGLKDAVNALTDPQRYAKSYLPNLIASFVPTLASDISRATDPKERRAESTLQRIQARTPLRAGLEPQVDILGRERESVGNLLEILADPTRPSEVRGNIVTGEIRRLVESGFDIAPTMLGDKAGYKGLTPEQNTKLWVTTGTLLNEKLTALFNDERYTALSEDQKAKTVEKFIKQAQIYGRVSIALELTQDLQGDELKKKLSELKTGGLLNREVFDRYVELR